MNYGCILPVALYLVNYLHSAKCNRCEKKKGKDVSSDEKQQPCPENLNHKQISAAFKNPHLQSINSPECDLHSISLLHSRLQL